MNWYTMAQKSKITYQFSVEPVREGGVDLMEYHCLMDFSGGASSQNRYESALTAFENFRKAIWPTFEIQAAASGVLSRNGASRTVRELFGIILRREGERVLREKDNELYARFVIRITPLNKPDLPIGNEIMKETLRILGFQET